MINLFDRVYLKHDNVLTKAEGQQKLIITDKNFVIPYASERHVQQAAGIIGVYDCMSDCDFYNGDREGLWTMLRLKAAKVIVIARKDYVAELLIQYWKSIFKDPSLESLYTLYQLTVNNENLHSYRFRERTAKVTSPNSDSDLIEKLTLEEFTTLFNKTDKVAALEGLEKRYLPFEYLLMSELGNYGKPGRKEIYQPLYKKIDMIVRKNIVGELISARDDFFFETHNFYLLNEGEKETPILDPLKTIEQNPSLSWVLDDLFEYGNEDEILAKYSLGQIKGFYEVYHRLFGYQFDDYNAIDFIQNKTFMKLVEYDIQDHKGNFFCSSAFVSKINGLLISYMYQQVRLNKRDVLQQYELV